MHATGPSSTFAATRRRLICGMLLALTLSGAGVASAASGGFDAQTFRVGSHVLSVGDSVARVVRLLGKPIYKEPIENRFGARRGEAWQYSLPNHALTLIIANGQVVAMRDQFEID